MYIAHGVLKTLSEYGSAVWSPAFLFTESQGAEAGSHAALTKAPTSQNVSSTTVPVHQSRLTIFPPPILSEGGGENHPVVHSCLGAVEV